MKTFDFNNQVVLITGGLGGIGRATADAFLECGARVVAVDLVAGEEAPSTDRLRAIRVDVADYSAVKECVDRVLAEEGQIDCLINNAGIARDRVVWKMEEKQWDEVIGVNLKGAFNFIRHVAPHFKERRCGKIVNVSSINGLRGKFGLANYAASKAGLIGLTKTVARELGPYNVNVNAIAPGYILTPLTESLPKEVIDAALAETVLGRLGEPQDVAHLILFLCSDLARHITGEVVKVDGGQYI